MEDRIQTLERISGLQVSHRTEKGQNVFTFGVGTRNKPAKTVFTYRKARIFAEGVALGRTLEKEIECQPQL